MRICFFTKALFYPESSSCYLGASKHRLESLANALTNKSNQVSIIALSSQAQESLFLKNSAYRIYQIGYKNRPIFPVFEYIQCITALISIRPTHVLVYNFSIEGFFIALAAIITNRSRVILIYEDAVMPLFNLRAFIDSLSFWPLFLLSNRSYLTPSASLRLKIRGKVATEIPYIYPKSYVTIPTLIRQGSKFNILFGGSRNKDTGWELFVQALLCLSTLKIDSELHFWVTGLGPDISTADAQLIEKNKSITIHSFAGCSRDTYNDILRDAHIGLSLKLPGGAYSSTTFPSKIPELVAANKVVISTKIPTVYQIFEDNIFYFDGTSAGLAHAIKSVTDNFDKAAQKSSNFSREFFSKYRLSSTTQLIEKLL
jgi:glycosyltransferase involved in cell wall biosynthesis